MTITYNLAPNPKWYIADNVGRPLGGGSMYTYRSLNKTDEKFIFQDPAGQFPWPNPVLFDENGSQGPFYWEIDSDNPDESYYIEVYDSDGVLQWTQDNFLPPQGGGGSVITTALDIENLVANNVMWRNIGTSQTPLPTFLTIAPGAHAGFATTSSNAGGDINFIKNNTNAIDQITFPVFPLGTTPFTGDVTPVDYCTYTCNNAPLGETSKLFQYPITSNVRNLSNQDVTVTIWAMGDRDISLSWRQFFGDGTGSSGDTITSIQTLNLTSDWQKFVMQSTIPNVSSGTEGACGNSALFLQVNMPLGVSCEISFQKPCVYLGSIAPDEDYHTYDYIDGQLNVPRTGDVRPSYSSQTYFYPGFIIMNDTSIGNAGSLATGRANLDTFPLYNFLYTNISNDWAPVSGGRSGDPIQDFQDGKTLTLMRTLGRALAMAGSGAGLTTRALGEFLGNQIITESAMPAHTHSFTTLQNSGAVIAGGIGWSFGPGTTGTTGNGAADGNMQPTTFVNYFIKL